jgi:hypothetical protein
MSILVFVEFKCAPVVGHLIVINCRKVYVESSSILCIHRYWLVGE